MSRNFVDIIMLTFIYVGAKISKASPGENVENSSHDHCPQKTQRKTQF